MTTCHEEFSAQVNFQRYSVHAHVLIKSKTAKCYCETEFHVSTPDGAGVSFCAHPGDISKDSEQNVDQQR
eukprot:CAMPEP_0206138804 /NCGR_PEP_ID=MMETSP1473-20131121/3703_1 /ASSEMBLY_ACC=CAM_ASM_001109 /TAXON_ID=1461547 /ORGANISM="Stichococcus sp, Strain RCC1054" /LENGTH=69 /DNA_ID=CAMNT_0053532329 /DNA_START=51 /DNA_END=256 /DNA_ORIENTATION=-